MEFDEENRRVCRKLCPVHGDPCSVVSMTRDEMKTAREVFGSQLNKGGFVKHTHLCFGAGKPHSWRSK